MLRLPTVVLHHALPGEPHYDWMVLDPTVPNEHEHALWAARVAVPPNLWHAASAMQLKVLPHHRRAYLEHYAGEAGSAAGWVRRVASGSVLCSGWHSQVRSWRVIIEGHDLHVTIRCVAQNRWLASAVSADSLVQHRNRSFVLASSDAAR